MITSMSSTYYSGLSGLKFPLPKSLYPAPYENASRMTYYAAILNSIEINSSFYKIPETATVVKWVDEVQENFKFTFKMWKGITHQKGLHFNKYDVELFFTAIDPVKDKKGCILIQFPPALNIEHYVHLEGLLKCITETNKSQGWNVAVEFRNKSWYQERVYDLINFHKSALVIQDIPDSSTPSLNQSSDFVYVRFHGPTGNYRESYSKDRLSEYAINISEWIAKGKTMYVYFNNTMGEAFQNLASLNRMLDIHLMPHQIMHQV